jgi:hypothetical protein
VIVITDGGHGSDSQLNQQMLTAVGRWFDARLAASVQ